MSVISLTRALAIALDAQDNVYARPGISDDGKCWLEVSVNMHPTGHARGPWTWGVVDISPDGTLTAQNATVRTALSSIGFAA
jgi:hypothetical protein